MEQEPSKSYSDSPLSSSPTSFPFKPYGDSLLSTLSTYLPYEAFKELQSVSTLFRNEMTDIIEDQSTWYKRIKEEFGINVPEKLWKNVDLRVIYKIIHEIHTNKKHPKTPSIYEIKSEANVDMENVRYKLIRSIINDETINIGKVLEEERKRMIEAIISYLLQERKYPRDALIWAISNSYTHLVKFLLSDPNVTSEERFRALENVSSSGGYLKIIELLIADPSVDLSEDDNLILQNAFRGGYTEIVDLLLQDPAVRESYRVEQLELLLLNIKQAFYGERRNKILNIWESVFNKYGLSIY